MPSGGASEAMPSATNDIYNKSRVLAYLLTRAKDSYFLSMIKNSVGPIHSIVAKFISSYGVGCRKKVTSQGCKMQKNKILIFQ